MKEKSLFCCRCGQESEVSYIIYRHLITRLELPYLFCRNCQTIGYSRKQIMNTVSDIRKNSTLARDKSFRELYRWAIAEMEKLMNYRTGPEFNQRLGRFKASNK